MPSYNTIIFLDGATEIAKIEIFHKYNKEISEKNYEENLYLYGPCDLRWGFQLENFNWNFINDIDILSTIGKNQENIYQSCNYLKNLDGNLIVLSGKDYKNKLFNEILFSFRLLK